MTRKLYVVSGITEQDWEEIFSCIRHAALFVNIRENNTDIKILRKIRIRDLDQDKDLKEEIEKRFWKGD